MSTPKTRTVDGKAFIVITVDFYNDPKIDDATTIYAGAADMLFRLTAYSRQNLSDGIVDLGVARRIGSPLDVKKSLDALTQTGLVVVDTEARTVTVVAYSRHQQTRDEVFADREKAAAWKKGQRSRSGSTFERETVKCPPGHSVDIANVSPDNALTSPMSPPKEVEEELNLKTLAPASAVAVDELPSRITQTGGSVVKMKSSKETKPTDPTTVLAQAIVKPWFEAKVKGTGSTVSYMGIQSIVVKAIKNGASEKMIKTALMGCSNSGFGFTAASFDTQLKTAQGNGPARSNGNALGYSTVNAAVEITDPTEPDPFAHYAPKAV